MEYYDNYQTLQGKIYCGRTPKETLLGGKQSGLKII